MPTFNRKIILETGEILTDVNHSLFNFYSGNFFTLEQGLLAKELSENDVIDVVLSLQTNQLTATLPDGRVFAG